MAKYPPSITAELIRLLYRSVPAALAANLVNSGLMVIALWPHADKRVLLGWVMAVISLSVGRGVLWRHYRRRQADDAGAPLWGMRYTWGATISGLLWGSTAFLFVDPANPSSLILVAFVIGGMGAGAVTGLSAHLTAFHMYLLCSMLPFELRLLSLGDRVSLVMAGMATVYVIGLLIIGRNFNTALVRALVLNQENEQLLATRELEVRLRTADLQDANADLEREINERKAAEARAEEARAEAERANQAKSRFLAAASHDLRQPLQSMFLFAASLHRYIAQKKGVEALVRVERGLDVLKGLLDSLLDLSRLDVNVIEPQNAVFPLRPMLDEIVATYGRIAAGRGIELKCGALADISVRSDPMLLGRMIRNLVENALRYTEKGSILLSSIATGDTVRIEVDDTGIGIAPDQLKRIFEEFHQVGNPERDKARGLGLGLAIVQRLSLILEHPVGVSSELGVGSIFSIELQAVAGIAAGPDAVGADEAANMGVGHRVMLIDDDPMVLLALNCIFEQWGYGVTIAGSEDEAVGRLQPDLAPHLIIADYRLRNGRVGTDAIQHIRAACGFEIPSILLTGETGTECVTEAESLGAVVLHKPVTPHDLMFALKHLIGADGQGEEASI